MWHQLSYKQDFEPCAYKTCDVHPFEQSLTSIFSDTLWTQIKITGLNMYI